MDGVDGRLELVGAGLAAAQRAAADDGLALGDLVAVPAPAVLVGQQDQLAAVAGAGVPARGDQQHEGEQTLDLRLVGHQLGQDQPRRSASARSSRRTRASMQRWPRNPR